MNIKTKNKDSLHEAIWNKLTSWNVVLKRPNDTWYDLYKSCAIGIYQNDLTFLFENIVKFKHFKTSPEFTKGDLLYDVKHNLLFLMCIFSENAVLLEFFFDQFNGEIDTNHIETILSKNTDGTTKKESLNFLMHHLERPYKSLSIVKCLIEKYKINSTLTNTDDGRQNCLNYAIDNYNYKSERCWQGFDDRS